MKITTTVKKHITFHNAKNRFSTVILSALLLFITHWDFTNADETELNWKQVATELDTLPFTSRYIDSLKKECSFSDQNRSLRTIEPLRIKKETLVYDVSWGPMNAGYIILTTEYDSLSHTIRVGGKALSNDFVGTFYKMRDYVISTIDADGLYPIFFEQHLREGKKYKADRWMLFDNKQEKIFIKDNPLKTVDSALFVNDYLSILYHVRSLKTAPGDTFSLKMYTDSKIYPIFFSCKDRKECKVESGTFNCVSIEPRLAGNGKAFNKKDKLEVLISDDSNRMPILIKSKIKFGVITARLVWYSKI